jgi:hypothetical protein
LGGREGSVGSAGTSWLGGTRLVDVGPVGVEFISTNRSNPTNRLPHAPRPYQSSSPSCLPPITQNTHPAYRLPLPSASRPAAGTNAGERRLVSKSGSGTGQPPEADAEAEERRPASKAAAGAGQALAAGAEAREHRPVSKSGWQGIPAVVREGSARRETGPRQDPQDGPASR